MGMAGFDVIDRDQGQAHVARFLEQAIKRGLVGYGAMDDGGSVTVVGEGQPVEPGGPPCIEVPLEIGGCGLLPGLGVRDRRVRVAGTGFRQKLPSSAGLLGEPPQRSVTPSLT